MPDPCPRCGSLRPTNAPGGLCPRCLLGNALDSDADVSFSFASEEPGRVLETLALSAGPMPRVLLPDTQGNTVESPVVRPSSEEMPSKADRSSRVQLLGEIARGGMGAILKGRDPDLGRDLAVKVLLDAHRDKPELVRRFVEEAQIGGQLQHPGVVPVYELGTFGDSRPYFTMKLVKGRTLAEILAERTQPNDDRPRFVAILLQVAQTVAYAHARGVIHRDLKPSNIMVGSFGEVQVMDWGLAKVLPRGGVEDDASAGLTRPKDETVIATNHPIIDPEGDFSRAGSVLGTPSYMAPEQARGETDRLDERCDVFALGSILAEVLTAQPAFTGRSGGEILRKSARGDLVEAFARLDGSGADVALVELAKDCLAAEPEDRPANAQEVADRLLDHINSLHRRLRDAELAQAAEHARAEEAKRTASAESARAEEAQRAAEAAEARARAERQSRRLQVGLAASLIGLMTLGGGGYAWVEKQKTDRVAKTARAVDEALADAARLRGEAQAAPPGESARWALALSAAQRAEALLAQGEADAPLRDRLKTLLTQLDREQAAAAEQVRQLQADRALLVDLESIRGDRADQLDLKQTDADYTAAFLKAGLDLDKVGPAEAGKWLATRSEPVELAGHLDDCAFVRRSAGRTEAEWRRPVAAARAADPDPWRDALRARFGDRDAAAVAEFRRLADDEPALDAQPTASLILLARQLKAGGDRERAASVLRRAVFRHPGEYWAHYELGMVHGQARSSDAPARQEEQVRHLTAGVAIRPASPIAHDNLGVTLWNVGKREQAVAEYREAIRLKPDYANAHNNLGVALRVQGKLDEAGAEVREAIRLKPDLTGAYQQLVSVLRKQGKVDQAVAEYREAIRLKPDDVNAYYTLAQLLEKLGRFNEAVAEYRHVIRLKPDDAQAYRDLGEALKALGNLDEAVTEYRQAIRLKPDDAVLRTVLGNVLHVQKKYDEAATAHREAIRLAPDFASAYNNLGVTFSGQGKLNEAVDEYHQAIRLVPDARLIHRNLGEVLRDLGKLDEAVVEFREAIRLTPNAIPNISQLVDVLRSQGKLDEAIAGYREAIRLKPDDAYAHFGLGFAMQRQYKLDEAIASLRTALRLEPDDDNILFWLRNALKDQGNPDEETAEFRLQVERARKSLGAADPRTAQALALLGANLVQQGQWAEAEPFLKECLAIREKAQPDAWTAFNTRSQLGGCLLGQGKYAEAEPLILSGYEGLKARVGKNPSGSETRLAEASERVVQLYEAWGQKEKAAEWRPKLVPSTSAERLGFAEMSHNRKQFAAATRYRVEALEADPKLAEDREVQPRYDAACQAALAGSGHAKDNPPPDDAARARFRGQALDWLKAELVAWGKVLVGDQPKARAQLLESLNHWKVDPDLASIRDPEVLAKLPEPERRQWQALWAEVDALLAKAKS